MGRERKRKEDEEEKRRRKEGSGAEWRNALLDRYNVGPDAREKLAKIGDEAEQDKILQDMPIACASPNGWGIKSAINVLKKMKEDELSKLNEIPCRFFAKGFCSRGEKCAYKHVMAEPDPLALPEDFGMPAFAPFGSQPKIIPPKIIPPRIAVSPYEPTVAVTPYDPVIAMQPMMQASVESELPNLEGNPVIAQIWQMVAEHEPDRDPDSIQNMLAMFQGREQVLYDMLHQQYYS